MIPYIFGLTSQIIFVFVLSFIFWGGIFLFFVRFSVFSFFSHLVPQGRPLVLGSFIAVIELVSIFIRSITLALRLSIKITTGHIFISLVRNGILGFLLSNSFVGFIFTGLLLFFYYLFEFGISFIQGVV